MAEAGRMTLLDAAMALGGFARLGAEAGSLRVVIRSLMAAAVEQGADVDPKHLAMLLAAFSACARRGARDESGLIACAELLLACHARGRRLPPESLPPLVRGLATHLRPAPAPLVRALEASLPAAVGSMRLAQLEVLLAHLAFIPGLSGRRGLGSAVFGACLAAPLEELSPAGLTGALRSAWSLGHLDPDFWVPALQVAESSINGRESSRRGGAPDAWTAEDLASVALVAARVVALASAAEPGSPGVAAASAASGRGPLLLTAAPAAASVVRVATGAATERASSLSPRDLGILATALARASVEDGSAFGVISHRALRLLRSPTSWAVFNSRDIAQLLVALARFSYRDEELIGALADRVAANLPSYDEKDLLILYDTML